MILNNMPFNLLVFGFIVFSELYRNQSYNPKKRMSFKILSDHYQRFFENYLYLVQVFAHNCKNDLIFYDLNTIFYVETEKSRQNGKGKIQLEKNVS